MLTLLWLLLYFLQNSSKYFPEIGFRVNQTMTPEKKKELRWELLDEFVFRNKVELLTILWWEMATIIVGSQYLCRRLVHIK